MHQSMCFVNLHLHFYIIRSSVVSSIAMRSLEDLERTVLGVTKVQFTL